jgi:PAS domain S-box-containing protein
VAGKPKRTSKAVEAVARCEAAQSPENIDTLSPEETRLMLHELQVHQIELEMQNEELRRTQVEMHAARARYFDLYDLAPVGYCTLSEKGLILQANLAAAAQLGLARGALIKQLFTRFILKGDQDIYYLQRKQLLESGGHLTWDLRMVKSDGTQIRMHLAATAAQGASDETVIRIVMMACNRP